MADHIGTGSAARLLGLSTRTVKRQAGAPGSDLATAVVTRLDGNGAFVFDRAKVLKVRDARLAAERARLDQIEAAS